MSRLGYRCDGEDCGYESRRHGPAAVVRRDGEWIDLCSSCYDDWDYDKQEVVREAEA